MSLELRVQGYGLEVRSYELRCHFELSPRAVTPSAVEGAVVGAVEKSL